MTERWRTALQLDAAQSLQRLLVAALDRLTNSIDTARFSWDFRYYIDMARRGLVPPLASPFAYRYLTPLLVRVISGRCRFQWRRVLACWREWRRSRSWSASSFWRSGIPGPSRGAWVAMLATAFSPLPVKFLLV